MFLIMFGCFKHLVLVKVLLTVSYISSSPDLTIFTATNSPVLFFVAFFTTACAPYPKKKR